MKIKRRCGIIISILVTLVLINFASADVLRPDIFQNGDIVCFVGDSITHSGFYHTYIYNYYLTRFTDRNIQIYNCGIGGHTAEKTLINFKWDVPKLNPTVITVMLGMNDLRARNTDVEKFIDEIKKLREKIRKLTDAKIIYISPTPYDEFLPIQNDNLLGFNSVLGKAGSRLKKMADNFNSKFIDFHSPMTEILKREKIQDPNFTIIGSDRIHPGRVGNMIMAYLFLKAQNAPSIVNKIEINADKGIVKSKNCKISNFSEDQGNIEFELLSNSLPFPVSKPIEPALKLVPIEKELNQEILKITNLPEGRYSLMIDNEKMGIYSADQLEKSVNLAFNEKTPQYRQSQLIGNLTMQKKVIEHKLGTESMLKVAVKKQGIKFNGKDRNNVYRVFKSQKVKDLFKPNGPLGKGGTLRYWKRYQKEKDTLDEIEKRISDIMKKLNRINEPKVHKYSIKKIW